MDDNKEVKVTRRRLVGWLGILSVFTAAGAAFLPRRKQLPPRMVKMLTREGKLVEVDANLIASAKTKISDKELQNWVTKK